MPFLQENPLVEGGQIACFGRSARRMHGLVRAWGIAAIALSTAIGLTGCGLFVGVHGVPRDLVDQERALFKAVRSHPEAIHVSIYCDVAWCRGLAYNLSTFLQTVGIQASDQVESPLDDGVSILLLMDREWSVWQSLVTAPIFWGTFGFFPFAQFETYRALAVQLESARATSDLEAMDLRTYARLDPDASLLREVIDHDDTGALVSLGDAVVVDTSDSQHQIRGWASFFFPTGWIGINTKRVFMQNPGYPNEVEPLLVEKVAIDALMSLLNEPS